MVSIMDDDKKTGESKSRILAVLKEGTCFGVVFLLFAINCFSIWLFYCYWKELAFLYNSTRTATVTSLTTVELLVYKLNFNLSLFFLNNLKISFSIL